MLYIYISYQDECKDVGNSSLPFCHDIHSEIFSDILY